MSKTCVLVVTAGRQFRHQKQLKLFLLGHLAYYGAGLRLYVGDCPTGGDQQTREFAEQMGIWDQLLVFEADWDGPCRPTCRSGHRRPSKSGDGTSCPAAGPYRNGDMLDAAVAAEADEKWVLACHDALSWSKGGTSDCAKQAQERGLPVFHLERLGRRW